jgi:hypothetical protein
MMADMMDLLDEAEATPEQVIKAFSEKYYLDDLCDARWKNSGNGRVADTLAGSETRNGYRHVVVLGRRYYLHRLVWLMKMGSWPPGQLDHINGQKRDNRLGNLRIATQAQNVHNRIRNGSFPTGVYKAADRGRYCARIQGADGKKIYLGYYDTAEEAAAAYAGASIILHGEFAAKLSRAA